MNVKRYIAVRKSGTIYEVVGVLDNEGLFGSYKLLIYSDKGCLFAMENMNAYITGGYFPAKEYTFTQIDETVQSKTE